MPVSYILFTIMRLLKQRNKKTVISKVQLAKAISEFLAEAPLPEEVKESLLEDFDLDYELEVIFDEYAAYVTNENGVITMSPYVKFDVIDNLLDEVSSDNDEELISIIDDFFEFNIQAFEIIGIKIEKKVYDIAIEIEKDVEKGYDELARIELCNDKVPNRIMNELKKNVIKRNILLNQIRSSLTIEEYNDLAMYSMHMADLLGIDTLTLKIENDGLEEEIEVDPFYRALFFIDTNKKHVFSESFYLDGKYGDEEGRNKEAFYMAIFDIINSRTNSNEKMTTDDDLVLAKYRLMYAMDMLFHEVGRFDYYLFMNKRNNLSVSNDYSFIEKDIFYFIDEIFEYTDKEMANDVSIDYANTIKSILIEAYYKLTKDERVIEAIKSHPNYGKYHFVTGLFDDIINKSKKKIKRKEDE